MRDMIPKETSNIGGAKSPKISSKWGYENLIGWCTAGIVIMYVAQIPMKQVY